MTNVEAIEHLKVLKIFDAPELREAIALAISDLERDRWISVEERLPEDTEPVLAMFDDVYLIAIYGNYAWSDVMTQALFYPTHWRPLPEPPKEET